jgi:penicillin-binding protein 1A
MARRPPKKPRKEPDLFDDDAEADDVVGEIRARRNTKGKTAKSKKPPESRVGWKLRLLWRTIKLGFWATAAMACVIVYTSFSLDQKGLLQIPERDPGIRLLASDGSVLAEKGAFNGDEVIFDALPEYVPQAIMAIEDRRFREHFGLDLRGFARAMFRNITQGRMSEGGSTLTQQLAKNLFLSPERTIQRKLQEAVLAVWLENKFSKDEILQLYLNRVYFGGGGGAIGIEKAARHYYAKSATELNLMEAATLAGVLKAPTTYNPSRNPEGAEKRAKLVLQAMVDEGYVTAEEVAEIEKAPTSVEANDYIPAKQYAVDWVMEQLPQLVKNYGESIVIETTIDPKIQATAEQSLRQRLTDNGKKLKVSQGAMVVLDTRGAVKAMVGGRSYKKSQYNRATKAKRQPGSTFKPFVYVQALERGYQPDSIEIDEPLRIGNWRPENHGGKYAGRVTLEQAFALSMNSVAVKLANDLGPANVVDTARRFGIQSDLGNDASIALGTSEVSLLELTSAFVPFSNGGTLIEPFVVKRISTRDGEVLYERVGSGFGKVIGNRELGMMNQMFRAVVRDGTAKNAQIGAQDVGGKTGTSQDYRDAWFIGFSPYLIGGVWLGNDDNSPTRNVTGGSLPALIWKDVMTKAHRNFEVAQLPGARSSVAVRQTEVAEYDDTEVQPEEIVVRKRTKKKRTLLDILFSSASDDSGNGVY